MRIRSMLAACRVAVLVSLLVLLTFSLEAGPPTASADSVGKVYWTDSGTGKISRANLDGSGAEDLITGLDSPQGIALDIDGGKMYWVETGTAPGKISRANLDGTVVEALVTTDCCTETSYIELDVPGGKMYWTSPGEGKVKRADLDGTDAEDIVVGENRPLGIAVDSGAQKVYWTFLFGAIRRADLDGSGVELVRSGHIALGDLAIDTANSVLYFTETVFGTPLQIPFSVLYRIDVSGTNFQVLLVQSVDGIIGLAVDDGLSSLFWTDFRLGAIKRWAVADVITGLDFPIGVALDISDVPKPTATETPIPTNTPTSTTTPIPTITPTPTPTPGPIAVGGVAELAELRPLPAATAQAADTDGVALIAAAALIGLASVGGVAWWARRRRIP